MAEATRQETLKCSAEQLKHVIVAYDQYPQFIDGLKSAKILQTNGSAKDVEFELELIKTFRYVLRLTESENQVSWELVQGDLFKKNSGSWSLKALGANQVEASYKIDVDLKMMIPSFVAKQVAGSNLPKMFRQFEARAQLFVKEKT